jgi:hypothetical protein
MLVVMLRRHSLHVGIALCLVVAVLSTSCGSVCGLGLHDRVTLGGNVSCCGGFLFRDVFLSGKGDASFDLSNTAKPSQPGLVDAFLVPTSCATLFDGPYPGSMPLCRVYTGPAAPGQVSTRVALAAGTYRVWFQAYTSNLGEAPYLIDVGVWDQSCRSPLQ